MGGQRRGRLLGWSLVPLMQIFRGSAVLLTCRAGGGEPDGNFSEEGLGKACQSTDAGIDAVFRTLAARDQPAGALIPNMARGIPMQAEMGGITSIDALPVNMETIARGPMPLKVAFKALRLFKINQRTQEYRLQFSLTWTWRDCRMLHACSMIHFSDDHKDFDMFWKPFYRILQQETIESNKRKARYEVHGDGIAILTEDLVGNFRCAFDFTEMPFDVQTCDLRIEMIDGTTSQIQMDWSSVSAEPGAFLDAEWQLDNIDEWEKSKTTTTKRTMKGDVEFSTLNLAFKMERRPSYSIKAHVDQAILIYLVSWVGLWVDPAAVPARAAVAVIPVLVMSNKMTAFWTDLPPISYGTRLDRFLRTVLVLIVLHTVLFGAVHVSGNWMKKRKDAASADEEKTQCGKIGTGVASVISAFCGLMHRWGDFHARWWSPLVLVILFLHEIGSLG